MFPFLFGVGKTTARENLQSYALAVQLYKREAT